MSAPSSSLSEQATWLVRAFAARGLRIATAESCTGGMVAAALTDVPGSSAVLERGFVTYSNEAKTDLLGVPEDLIAAEGAVSEAVARAMAEGALARSRADVAIAVTGVAGPGGGSALKPIGLVHFALAGSGGIRHQAVRFGDIGRGRVRQRSVANAFDMLAAWLNDQPDAASPTGTAGP